MLNHQRITRLFCVIVSGSLLRLLHKEKKNHGISLAGRVVFHIPDWLHHLLMGGRILFKNTLEAYTDYYLQYKLNQVFQEHRVVSLITLLRGGGPL